MRSMSAGLFLTLFVTSNAWAGGESVTAFKGARSVVKASHLIPVMKDSEGYGEKYTFKANFEGGGELYFSLAILSSI